MNKHDRDNLKFLLSADEATLKDWYNTVEEDDINYALELLAEYKKELTDSAEVSMLEGLDYIDESELDPARVVLGKFMLQ